MIKDYYEKRHDTDVYLAYERVGYLRGWRHAAGIIGCLVAVIVWAAL